MEEEGGGGGGGGEGTPWCVFGLTFPLTWKAGMEREEAVLKTALL